MAIRRETDTALHHPGAGDAFWCVGQISRYAMEARILRPLLWFGLLEQRSEKIPNSQFGDRHFYRKAQLFDRLLTFAVQVELSESVRH